MLIIYFSFKIKMIKMTYYGMKSAIVNNKNRKRAKKAVDSEYESKKNALNATTKHIRKTAYASCARQAMMI